MIESTKKIYTSNDGKDFFDKNECLKYEDKIELLNILQTHAIYDSISCERFGELIANIIYYYENKS